MKQNPSTNKPSATPSHDEIAQCARELWTESGCPEGQDYAIWLKAELQLVSSRQSLKLVANNAQPQAEHAAHTPPAGKAGITRAAARHL